jgi:hypothetical protein
MSFNVYKSISDVVAAVALMGSSDMSFLYYANDKYI